MQELINRLRNLAEYEADLSDESKWERIEWEAADLIESQAAEIAKYKALCDQLSDALNGLAIAMDLRLDDDDLSQDSKEAFFALEAWRALK